MGYLNQIKKIDDDSHLNWMGGKSFDIKSPIMRLRIAAASCFFGEPQYYHVDRGDTRPKRVRYNHRATSLSEKDLDHLRATLDEITPSKWRSLSPAEMMIAAIDDALDFDIQATLGVAIFLRNIDKIRTTPQVILVRAANHTKARGKSHVRRAAREIIKRADEPVVGLAYQLATYGKKAPIPNSLKKAWKYALESFDEYQLGKYQMSNREVKLVDVVNLVHPKSEAVDKLVNGKLSNNGKTWEAIVSAEGSSKESWEKSLDVMGHMALLRNLRNLLKFEVPLYKFTKKLVKGAKYGKQLPFRYYSAYQAIGGASAQRELVKAIENSMQISIGELPSLPGKTMALCDNSGSATGTTTSSMGTMCISTIGNLTGVITGMMSDEGYVGVFGDDLKKMPVEKQTSVFKQLDKAESLGRTVGGATENGIWIFFRDAIKNKEHWDNIFVFSDMQAGHGGLYGIDSKEYSKYAWRSRHIDVASLIKEYRKTVNKNVKVFLIQVAGYQDTLVPEFYDGTYIFGGWGEGVLKFSAAMANLDKEI